MAGSTITALNTCTDQLTTSHHSIGSYNYFADRFRKHKKCIRDLGEEPLGDGSKLEIRRS